MMSELQRQPSLDGEHCIFFLFHLPEDSSSSVCALRGIKSFTYISKNPQKDLTHALGKLYYRCWVNGNERIML